MYGKKLGWRATIPAVHCHDIVHVHVYVCIWTSDNGYTILYTQCYVLFTYMYVNPSLCTCMCTHVHVYKRSVSVYNTCMIHIIQPYIYTCTCVT